MMEIVEIRALTGRNIYSHHPVIKLTLNLETLADKKTNEIPFFNDKLLASLPSLKEHQCSLGRPGGFLERLYSGTYLGHVVEHVILELQAQAGMERNYGKTLDNPEPGLVDIVFEYISLPAAEYLASAAVLFIKGLVEDTPLDLLPIIAEAKRIREDSDFGPSTKAIIKAARRRGIPFLPLKEGTSLIQLGTGCYQKRIWATITDGTGCIGVDIAGDKHLTKEILYDVGIPVPPGYTACSEEDAVKCARKLNYPVAVKPYDGNQGKGVSLRLYSDEEVRRAYRLACKYREKVLVEKHIEGHQYRLLVVGREMVAAAERIPAHVIGDGYHTIRELVEMANKDPLRGEGHSKPLTRIKLDEVTSLFLSRYGLTLDYRPSRGEVIFLRENTNLSTGGMALDVTPLVHPQNALLAVRAAGTLGLDIAGIDLVATNIALPVSEYGGAVIEVNAAPGIRMHLYPSQGEPRDVASIIVDRLFPPGKPCCVPIVSVTGTNGKTTTTRLVNYILRLTGCRSGMATTDGIFIDGECIMEGDTTGPRSARVLLRDPSVEAVVLETARGGLIRSGLGYDCCDVAVVTNISRDHLGQDNVETVEDLVFVKSLVVESVKPGGAAVLNADDPNVLKMVERVRGEIIFFSKKGNNVVIRRHLSQKGRALIVNRQKIIFAHGSRTKNLIDVAEVPLTIGGRATHNLENALAAAAACIGLGVDLTHIVQGLKGFTPSLELNPGRTNLYEMGNFCVMVDYGHNEAGIKSTLELARRLGAKRVVGVIGVPGDRRDDLIQQVGKVSAQILDKIVLKEDRDPRGRERGEVARLLYRGVMESLTEEKEVITILDEEEAVKHVLQEAHKGDIVVIFYEKLMPVIQILNEFKNKIRQLNQLAANRKKFLRTGV